MKDVSRRSNDASNLPTQKSKSPDTHERPAVRTVFIEDVSKMIGKRATTIRTCATNAKFQHLIPTPFKLPNSRRLCWLEDDVVEWINRQREPQEVVGKRPRGRPRKSRHH